MYAKDVPPGTVFYHGTKADLAVGDLIRPGEPTATLIIVNGSYGVAIVLSLVTVVTLWVMEPLKRAGHLDSGKRKTAGGKPKA